MIAKKRRKLLEKGKHREASQMYGRLAESAGDRRQRSLLRAKEREARDHGAEAEFEQLRQRCDLMVSQGDRTGAIRHYEAALSSALTPLVAGRITEAVDGLKRHQRGRRRMVILAIILVLVVVGLVVAWVMREQIMPHLPAGIQEALGGDVASPETSDVLSPPEASTEADQNDSAEPAQGASE